MARYDDDPYYNEEDESRRDARRDSLMQRRLRAARGEEADEGLFDEYDDVPPPRMAGAMRPRYAPAPAYSTGGGCASAALYLALGAIAVVLIFALFSQQILSRLVPNVPAEIRQIVATPTTTLRDRGGTILQIRGLNRLETQSFLAERVIEAKVERGNILDTVLGDRLLLIASGEVVAGVDLSKLEERDVTISQDGKSITLTLPPSEIFSKALDNARTRVYDRQAGIFAPDNKDLETEARLAAEAEILNAACEANVMQKAADEAKRSMEQFLKLLDFESVTVNVSAGQCVAPGTGPAPATPVASIP
jgi:hypothetical protein